MKTSLVSAPWATVDDLPPGFSMPPLPMSWDELMLSASEMLYELSGRQWRGSAQSRVQVTPAGSVTVPLLPGWVPTGGSFDRPWLVADRGMGLVRLPSSPVTSVDEVTVGDTTITPAMYRWDGAGILEMVDGCAWPCDGSMFVTFTHGIDPPLGGKRACASLAVELAKASVSDGSCRLKNFQTITREGVTVGGVNLRDALVSGMTGLYEVDLWLKSTNPHAMRRRGGAWSPDFGRTRRVSS